MNIVLSVFRKDQMPARHTINQNLPEPTVYDDGYLRIEHENFFVSCLGERIKLPKTEFLIVSRLSKAPERVVTYHELWDSAWENGIPFNIESLKVHIYRLRRTLEPLGVKIETMVNVGYSFIPKTV